MPPQLETLLQTPQLETFVVYAELFWYTLGVFATLAFAGLAGLAVLRLLCAIKRWRF